jgi:hypothetical protein
MESHTPTHHSAIHEKRPCKKFPGKFLFRSTSHLLDSLFDRGFQFWRQGYWADHLRGRPYHISALYVVDLQVFRQQAIGDRLRGVYDSLAKDPNSLANLDQVPPPPPLLLLLFLVPHAPEPSAGSAQLCSACGAHPFPPPGMALVRDLVL